MNVLISGASMAGLSAAHWFSKLGHRTTVLELAASLRPGGAPIDVRGDALGVADRMGILKQIHEQRVTIGEPGPVLDGSGKQVTTMDLRDFANESVDDIEITRDRLNNLLLESVPQDVEFRFKTHIESLTDRDNGVEVKLSDGTTEHYDLVIGADGLHSNVRRLAFGPEADFVHHIGYYVALVNLDTDREWERAMLNIPGLAVGVRDSGDGPQAMMLARSPQIDYDYRDLDAQRSIIRDFLSRVPAWQVPALSDRFTDPDSEGFYFDSVSQTRMKSWTKGHVAVVGDAGHCAALLSGMGTSLAMLAAELLAKTWTEADRDLDAASDSYHNQLRPYVDKAQEFVHEGGKMMVPPTQKDLDERNALLQEFSARRNAAS